MPKNLLGSEERSIEYARYWPCFESEVFMLPPKPEVIAKEMEMLRRELHDLKECQIKFVSSTPTITGFLLGVPYIFGRAGDSAASHPIKYLLPLLVLLPAWWVFFDKAKTITRIVGYYRVLEALACNEFQPAQFPGWERSLGIWRGGAAGEIWKSKRGEILKSKGFLGWILESLRAILLVVNQRYWLLAFYTFALLSVICLAIPCYVLHINHIWPDGFEARITVIMCGLVAYCAVANLIVLGRLMWGQHSYDATCIVWVSIFNDTKYAEKPAFGKYFKLAAAGNP
jgi:hypothetical protein